LGVGSDLLLSLCSQFESGLRCCGWVGGQHTGREILAAGVRHVDDSLLKSDLCELASLVYF
jgi:hypothetical protein